ncbi:hypothetical protein Nepgr_029209 [Nepenthes gracilis]|uniref:Uncharacterized protein n=1 Tax=Nepenthes gracilis TaxID=150966 RepID=A0AAD3TEF2_NEPGR|nr:hypothetical protein Nepgr_029209 [Nepenthes gracilis]
MPEYVHRAKVGILGEKKFRQISQLIQFSVKEQSTLKSTDALSERNYNQDSFGCFMSPQAVYLQDREYHWHAISVLYIQNSMVLWDMQFNGRYTV